MLAPWLTQTACAAQCLPLSHCPCLNPPKELKAIQQKLCLLLRSSEAVLLSRPDKSRRARISGHLKIARMTPGFLWFFPDSKIMLWTCPKWKKTTTSQNFCFARIFTKMSPDEELGKPLHKKSTVQTVFVRKGGVENPVQMECGSSSVNINHYWGT